MRRAGIILATSRRPRSAAVPIQQDVLASMRADSSSDCARQGQCAKKENAGARSLPLLSSALLSQMASRNRSTSATFKIRQALATLYGPTQVLLSRACRSRPPIYHVVPRCLPQPAPSASAPCSMCHLRPPNREAWESHLLFNLPQGIRPTEIRSNGRQKEKLYRALS